ncbi:MAG: GTPase HflX, partial [Deltaproteobacteria bacterium]|nr:GTPase HflX [Deltaproteobacteria bacterium]
MQGQVSNSEDKTIARISSDISCLKPSHRKRLNNLFKRKLDKDEFVSRQLVNELREISLEIQREITVLFSRDGKVLDVFAGRKDDIWISKLPGTLTSKSYYSGRRIVKTSFAETIPERDILLLKKLRLDCLVMIYGAVSLQKVTAIMRTPPGSDKPLSYFELDKNPKEENFYRLIESYEEEAAGFRETLSPDRRFKRALIVGCGNETEEDIRFCLDELANLLSTLNICAVKSVWQKRDPESAYLTGKGKLTEIRELAEINECDIIVFYNTLTPVQKRNIENETGFLILDRNQIILDIFAKRAKSNEGKLQVEHAYLKYQLPRLSEKDAGLSRLVGGYRTKGPGETKLEVMRRRLRDRIALLNKRIENIRKRRDLLREKRKSSGIPQIAIVGYTNAGKSTLLNRITKSSVYVEDKLFATLDPATRRYTFPDGFSVLFSDTVGFIRNLPEELKNAFMATFEEIRDADLI